MKIPWYNSFRYRLLTALVLLPILSTLLFITFGLDIFKDQISSQYLSFVKDEVRHRALLLDSIFQNKVDIVKIAASEIIENGFDKETAVFNSNDHFLMIELIDNKTRETKFIRKHPQLDQLNKDVLASLLKFSKNQFSTFEELGYFFVSTEVDDKKYTARGVLQAGKSFLSNLTNETNYFVVNDKAVLFGTAEKFPAVDIDYLQTNFLPEIAQFDQGAKNVILPSNQAAYSLSFSKIPNTKNMVINLAKANNIDEQFRQIYFQFMLIIVAVLSASLLVGLYFSKRLSSSLSDLTGAIQAIQKGNLGISLKIPGKDEVSLLSKQFSEMSKDLALQFKTIQEQKTEIVKAQNIATTDKLTGINNYLAFLNYFTKLGEDPNKIDTTFGFFILDIDHFKRFNDDYGHLQGDEALRVVAKKMTQTCVKGQFVGRYGGEEFISIFPASEAEEVAEKMEVMRKALESVLVKRVDSEGEDLKITASFGGYFFQLEKREEVEDYIKEIFNIADQKLYESKEKGRNCSSI